MKFIKNQTEEDRVYDLLMSQRCTKFKVNGITVTQNIIQGTEKERERECRKIARDLVKLTSC